MKTLIRSSVLILVVVELLIVVGSCSGYDGTTHVSVGVGYGYGPGFGYGPGWGEGWGGGYYPGRPMGPYW